MEEDNDIYYNEFFMENSWEPSCDAVVLVYISDYEPELIRVNIPNAGSLRKEDARKLVKMLEEAIDKVED